MHQNPNCPSCTRGLSSAACRVLLRRTRLRRFAIHRPPLRRQGCVLPTPQVRSDRDGRALGRVFPMSLLYLREIRGGPFNGPVAPAIASSAARDLAALRSYIAYRSRARLSRLVARFVRCVPLHPGHEPLDKHTRFADKRQYTNVRATRGDAACAVPDCMRAEDSTSWVGSPCDSLDRTWLLSSSDGISSSSASRDTVRPGVNVPRSISSS